ncbi:hypothetical protein [Ruegeria arenilitoris]|uniref:hypothetical protein n=1 Tax=Ruegeria arenilitoris TaxID=1173585 RepID=UPI00147A36D3
MTRRILLHLGLHKTGTTAAQSFLFENRTLIWPRHALVLPYVTRKSGLSEAATRHSLYGTFGTLSEFGNRWRELLATLDFGEKRGLILSEENFSGLRPSRNLVVGYAEAPDLAACLVDTLRNRLVGSELDITVYLSLRQRGSWIRSLWAHDLQRTRLVQDFDTFRERLEELPSLQQTADAVRDRLPSVRVQTEWLEDLREHSFGPGTPFAEFLDLPPEKAALLVKPTRSNPALPQEALSEMLELNRSGLDEAALVRQKARIVERAQNSLTTNT